MRTYHLIATISTACAISAVLTGCGAGQKAGIKPKSDPIIIDQPRQAARAELLEAPTRLHSWDAITLKKELLEFGGAGPYMATLAGPLLCGVDVYQFKYSTVGAAGEAATATGALMVPTGNAATCLGARSMVLYGHGNTKRREANMADIRPDTPLGVTAMAALSMYAAQGYVVVAPNYVGYHTSSLTYHPHHIADQQSKDMIDALAAARKALPTVAAAISQNGKLFITGFSEGGYATMATHRAMQAAGMTVTASSPQAGSYAESLLEAMVSTPDGMDTMAQTTMEDRLTYIMKFVGWQKAYGDIYQNPSDLFPAAYAAGLETLLPTVLGNKALKEKVPPYLLGTDMPNYASLPATQQIHFGPPDQSLLKTSVVTAILADAKARPCPTTSASAPLACSPTHPVRKAWLKNDMRDWVPTAPMLMCGGHADPQVDYRSSTLTMAYFQAHNVQPGLVTLLDVDSPVTANDPYAVVKDAFSEQRSQFARLGLDTTSSDLYHGNLAFFACLVAGREFFNRF